ncbi:hypothetical protein [Pseudomonas moorei]|uniref:hypothetical protein n=1 Tax=Pseudomonas moorei TaxID=395599 RepID=UPI0036F1D135
MSTEESGYYDGIAVSITDGEQSVRKRLYAKGANSVSLHGVTASVTHDSLIIDMPPSGGGGGGGPSQPARVSNGFSASNSYVKSPEEKNVWTCIGAGGGPGTDSK